MVRLLALRIAAACAQRGGAAGVASPATASVPAHPLAATSWPTLNLAAGAAAATAHDGVWTFGTTTDAAERVNDNYAATATPARGAAPPADMACAAAHASIAAAVAGCGAINDGYEHPLSCLGGLLLFAVPKKKVSVWRKKIRATHKHLRRVPNVRTCRVCGAAHMPHMLCPKCGAAPFKRWNRMAEAKRAAHADEQSVR